MPHTNTKILTSGSLKQFFYLNWSRFARERGSAANSICVHVPVPNSMLLNAGYQSYGAQSDVYLNGEEENIFIEEQDAPRPSWADSVYAHGVDDCYTI